MHSCCHFLCTLVAKNCAFLVAKTCALLLTDYTGVSLGPVLQVGGGDGAKLGLQGTAWINYYIGLDYRMRFFRDQKHHSAGLYAKLPVATTGLEDGDGDWDSGDSWDWD